MFRPTYVIYNFGPDAPAEVLNLTARQLYNSQDNLAAVVNFLANSIAQLPLKVYTRDGTDDRKRDRDSAAAKLLWRPNKEQTCFEFIRAMSIEYFLFGCVDIWVLPDAESASGWQLRIIPTAWEISTEKTDAYAPSSIRVVAERSGSAIDIPRSEFVRFSMYSPGNPGGYVSPVSALRQTLEEQIQAGRFRRDLWKSSGRLNAQIIRPKDVEPWNETTRKKWIATFREAWGAGGSNAGAIPLMEDGMEIKPFSTSFKEQQWTESVKLSREAVAAAYRINPSLVWHSDAQTYASSKDNARALYAECLGPDLQMFQQRINSFLLPMIGADPGTYVEFDLTEKLKGSFEERANIMQASVGGPWLTRNEARRDNNLPPIEGGDALIVPLNVETAGQVATEPKSARQGNPAIIGFAPTEHRIKSDESEEEPAEIPGTAAKEEIEAVKQLISKFFKRQAKSIIPKLGTVADWWDKDRWDKELAEDLEPLLNNIAVNHGETMAEAMGSEFVKDLITAYLKKLASVRAELINDETRLKLEESLETAEDGMVTETVQHEFDIRAGMDAALLGSMIAKTVTGWSIKEAAHQARSQGSRKRAYKVWVTGPRARGSHAALNGERVPIDSKFSNGADWPGDDSLSPDESCGCNCTTKVIIMEG